MGERVKSQESLRFDKSKFQKKVNQSIDRSVTHSLTQIRLELLIGAKKLGIVR